MRRRDTGTTSGCDSKPVWARRPRVVGLRSRARYPGFTIIELLIVVAIMFTLMAIAAPAYTQALEAARVTRAIGDVRAMANDILAFQIRNGPAPDSLAEVDYALHRDPWGNPYVYAKFATGPGKGGKGGVGGARKDKFLVPLNSLYDLYSLGKDGESVPPLAAKASWDDIIMANDGGFVGLAKDF